MSDSPDWRASRLRRLQVRAIAGFGYPALAALGRTWRWTVEGTSHLDDVRAAGRIPVLAFWHGRVPAATYYFRRRDIVVMVSENFDGEWIARIIHRFGYTTARGSTSRRARRALLQLRRDAAAGRTVGFAVDGPRGPAQQAQAGAVWLAGATGCPVVPFHLEADRHWTIRSWDRTQIPKPFSRVALVIGAPLDVPSGRDDVALDVHRRALEEALNGLVARAQVLVRPAE